MAKILLNVELNSAPATQQIKALQTNFMQLANSLKGMNVNKDLTAQLNALSKAYQAINQNASNATKQTNANARAMSAQAKLVKAYADALVKLQRAQASQTESTKDNTKAKKDNTKETERANQSIVSMLPNILKWQVAMTAIMLPIRKVREALHSLNETLQKTEDTVVVLQRVLGKGDSQKLATDLYQIAQAYGQTFENVSEVATNFARTGMDWEQTVEATKSALMAMNVAELDATQASDGLIAVLAQFNLTAQDSESVIDKINKTANSFPVTQAKMLAALQRTGGTAANANMTLEQTLGLITSLSKATGRSGENIGTALNSLINYSSKSKALDTFAGVSDSVARVVEEYRKGAASIYDVWKELSRNINNMQEEQLDLLDQYFKSDEGSQLAQELGSELGELNDDIAGVYSTANTFRKNYFIALLKNIETATQAEQIALDAEGYSQKANNQYLDTYTAKVNTLQSKWQELANDEQGILKMKKELVDVGVLVLDFVDSIGGLTVAIPALVSVLGLLTGHPVIAALSAMVSVFSAISSAIDDSKRKAQEFRKALIETWDSEANDSSKLQQLYKRYEKLTERNEQFYQVEKDIVELLGEKATALDGLTQGTDAYSQALAHLTEVELEQREKDARLALFSAKASFDDLMGGATSWMLQGMLRQSGLDVPSTGDTLNDYQLIDKARTELLKKYEEAVAKSQANPNNQNLKDDVEAISQSLAEVQGLMAVIDPAYAKYKDLAEQVDYFSKGIAFSTSETAESTDDINDGMSSVAKSAEQLKEELAAAKKELEEQEKLQDKINALEEAQLKLQEAIREAQKEYMLNIVEQYVDSLEQATTLEEKQNAVIEARAELEKSIAEAKQKALLAALKAERESAEKTKDLEQKRLDIEKARIALANAQANRSVKVYNSATGSFEWQADAKAVADARDNLGKAIDSYNSDIESNAYSELEEAINNGNTDTKTLRRIITKWASQWEGDSNPAWMTSIDSIITDFQNYVPSADEISSATGKVETAVSNLNKYLKDQAIKEIKTAINSGNVSASAINSILNKWLKNGEGTELYKWGTTLATQIVSAQGKYDANNSKVQSAQQSVFKAEDALNSIYAGAMWDEANAMIESGSYNAKSINTLAAKYRSLGVSEDVVSKIQSILRQGIVSVSSTGVKNTTVISGGGLNKNAVYDDGGILNGLGGIKATTQPETVLNPDLTKQILQPSSNAAFSSFAQSLGLLFGTSKQLATSKAVSTVNNNNNSGNTSNYTVNGVPITSEVAKKYTVAEIFDNFALV